MRETRRRGRKGGNKNQEKGGEGGGGERRQLNLNLTLTPIIVVTILVTACNETQDTRHKKEKIAKKRSGGWASHSIAPAGHEVTATEPVGQ